jgi:hypothetical protein
LIIWAGYCARCYQGRRRLILRGSLYVLHLQHLSTKYAKRDHANSDRSLLQDKFHRGLEFVLVLRQGGHVCDSWLRRTSSSSLHAYWGINYCLHCTLQSLSGWDQELQKCVPPREHHP